MTPPTPCFVYVRVCLSCAWIIQDGSRSNRHAAARRNPAHHSLWSLSGGTSDYSEDTTSKSRYLDDGRRSNKWAAPILVAATRASLCLLSVRDTSGILFLVGHLLSYCLQLQILKSVFLLVSPQLCKNISVYLEVFPSHARLWGNISVLASTLLCGSCLIYIYYLTVRYTVSRAPAHHAPAKGMSPGEQALNSVVFPATSDTYRRSEV